MSQRGGDKAEMSTLRILHSADLHLDSPFEGLTRGKAAIRRAEQRQLRTRRAELARTENVDLVLLAGDLLDSESTYLETGEELLRSLQGMGVPVFIAPGNHDHLSHRSPYMRLKLPGNVHVFTGNEITCVELPELGARVYGAAFTDTKSRALLSGFTAERTGGIFNILCLHGEVGAPGSPYDTITAEDLAASGMDYAALGHIHKASGLMQAGGTYYSWPGCPEGRGFDEIGEKTVSIVELSDGGCTLEEVSFAARRYEVLTADVTGSDPLLAIHTLLPDETVRALIRSRKLFPCLFGSGLKLTGGDAFLAALERYAAPPEYPAEFGARVFKIMRDAQGNRLTCLKVTGGQLRVRAPLTY